MTKQTESEHREYCPECDALVVFDYDGYEETYCEDCGSHSAVHCDECGEVFDHVWGYDRIEEYQKERKEKSKLENCGDCMEKKIS